MSLTLKKQLFIRGDDNRADRQLPVMSLELIVIVGVKETLPQSTFRLFVRTKPSLTRAFMWSLSKIFRTVNRVIAAYQRIEAISLDCTIYNCPLHMHMCTSRSAAHSAYWMFPLLCSQDGDVNVCAVNFVVALIIPYVCRLYNLDISVIPLKFLSKIISVSMCNIFLYFAQYLLVVYSKWFVNNLDW